MDFQIHNCQYTISFRFENNFLTQQTNLNCDGYLRCNEKEEVNKQTTKNNQRNKLDLSVIVTGDSALSYGLMTKNSECT